MTKKEEGSHRLTWIILSGSLGLYLVYPWLHAHEWVLVLLFLLLLFALVSNRDHESGKS